MSLDPSPSESRSRSLLEIVRRSATYLGGHGVANPRLEAELLIGHCLNLSRLELYLQFDRPLQEVELSAIRPVLHRRAAGAPLAHISGRREFYGLDFEVGQSVLIPRPETELLVELALQAVAGPLPTRIADLGCGSGCLGIAIAHHRPGALVDLVDLSEDAATIARRNVAHHGLQDRVRVWVGNWAEPLSGRGPYDLIVSNPPYVTGSEWAELDPGVRGHEPRLALLGGEDGLMSYRQLLPQAARVLRPHGVVLLECDQRRISAVRGLARDAWPAALTGVHRDLSGRERVLEVRLA